MLQLELLALLGLLNHLLELRVVFLHLFKLLKPEGEFLNLSCFAKRMVVLFACVHWLKRSVSSSECVSHGHSLLLIFGLVWESCHVRSPNPDVQKRLGAEVRLSMFHYLGKLCCCETIEINGFLTLHWSENLGYALTLLRVEKVVGVIACSQRRPVGRCYASKGESLIRCLIFNSLVLYLILVYFELL